MQLQPLDLILIFVFFAVVVGVSLYKSRQEHSTEEYFLAGRNLLWPVIGFSLIADNISTEHFVGLSGQAAGEIGMAVASYEWISVICMVLIAIFLLPRLLSAGIYTMPEFLEYRYSATARALMAIYTVLIYGFVTISAVMYSGALMYQTLFGNLHNPKDLLIGIFIIALIATIYATWGGLKAVAWAGLFQGATLLFGAALTTVIGFYALRTTGTSGDSAVTSATGIESGYFSALADGVHSFFHHNSAKLHLILPAHNLILPWTSLVIGFGLWIPCFYYWGLNQTITQKMLAAHTLREGQFGTIFAAVLKATIPVIIVFPAIMAAQLYRGQLTNPDEAYAFLIRNLLPPGARGLMVAAIGGAVIGVLGSMLNSASTIFTMDLYKRHWRKSASSRSLVVIGRSMTIVFALIGCAIAPILGQESFKGIFNFIQEFQGFLSPGVAAAFVFGLTVKRAPPLAGVAALVLSPILYSLLMIFFGNIPFLIASGITIRSLAFLDRMTIVFVTILAVMTTITWWKPLPSPQVMPVRAGFDMRSAPSVKLLGAMVVGAIILLYVKFW
jgi:solute:Na+ symporter, SSS family